METLSFQLFKNTELLNLLGVTILLIVFIIALFLYFPIYTKHLSKRDCIFLTLLTVCYGVVSFWKLGSTQFPSSTWQPSQEQQHIILVLPEETSFDAIYAIYGEGDNNANLTNYQLGFEDMMIEGSNDLNAWTELTKLSNKRIYQYDIHNGTWDYQYIRITPVSMNQTLTEIGFKKRNEEYFLPVGVYEDPCADTTYPATLLIDEQDALVVAPTYLNQAYFDEVYHPRNAWEIAHGQYMYASVHPLFGTTLIALSIRLFGMHPFAWRLPGVLVGIAMVPLFYLLLKKMFHKTFLSSLGTFYFCTEFMHYTTSRIATLEPFSVFFIMLMYYFMLCYIQLDFYHTPLKQQWKYLLFCGLTMGLGIATKWTVCYSAVGLAILLFVYWFQMFRMYRLAKKEVDTRSLETDIQEQQHICNTFQPTLTKTILLCFIFFIFIPIILYFISYIPTKVWRDGYSLQNVWNQIQYIYSYHTNLEATHPYQSTWYQWLLDVRPVWYHISTDSSGYTHSISAFTNPILTWVGLFSILYIIYEAIVDHKQTSFFIVVGYLSALLPWVGVSRCIFAYHFYPTSIFMLLAIVACIHTLLQLSNRFKYLALGLAAFSLGLFIIFLPAISGFGTSLDYLHFLEWFPSWYFG